MMWDGGVGGGIGSLLSMGLMMFFGLLFLVGIVLLIVWAARAGGGGSSPAGSYHRSGTQEACDIARLRYARGEITKDQFEEICRTVGS